MWLQREIEEKNTSLSEKISPHYGKMRGVKQRAKFRAVSKPRLGLIIFNSSAIAVIAPVCNSKECVRKNFQRENIV